MDTVTIENTQATPEIPSKEATVQLLDAPRAQFSYKNLKGEDISEILNDQDEHIIEITHKSQVKNVTPSGFGTKRITVSWTDPAQAGSGIAAGGNTGTEL
jgi:hypothetical protein